MPYETSVVIARLRETSDDSINTKLAASSNINLAIDFPNRRLTFSITRQNIGIFDLNIDTTTFNVTKIFHKRKAFWGEDISNYQPPKDETLIEKFVAGVLNSGNLEYKIDNETQIMMIENDAGMKIIFDLIEVRFN